MTACLPASSIPDRRFWRGSSSSEQPVRSLLGAYQAGTGLQALATINRNRADTIGSAWNSWLSSPATQWSTIPEDALDMLDSGTLKVDSAGLQFLLYFALLPGYSVPADAALRFLGILLEELPIETSAIRNLLPLLLDHPDPSRRYYTIKALWQGRVFDALPALARLEGVEQHPIVRQVAQQASSALQSSRRVSSHLNSSTR